MGVYLGQIKQFSKKERKEYLALFTKKDYKRDTADSASADSASILPLKCEPSTSKLLVMDPMLCFVSAKCAC